MGRFDRDDASSGQSAAPGAKGEEQLKATVERQVRAVVEEAMARAIAIEDRAAAKARALEHETQARANELLKQSQERASEVLNVAIERAERMVEGTDTLQRELGKVIASFKEEIELLTAELQQAKANLSAAGGPAAASRARVGEDEPETAATTVRDMLRQEVVELAQSGRTREDAERMLMRFDQWPQHRDLLDEVYNGGVEQSADLPRRSFLRRRKPSPTP
jgi:hypothetical protein